MRRSEPPQRFVLHRRAAKQRGCKNDSAKQRRTTEPVKGILDVVRRIPGCSMKSAFGAVERKNESFKVCEINFVASIQIGERKQSGEGT